MKYILALDQGTTSSRAILYDKHANAVAAGQYEFKQHYPQPGWVEHDAREIWQTQWRSIETAFKEAGCSWQDVAAIGITNQRETVALWDKQSGEPVGHAIVWQDRRTAAICDKLKENGKESWVQEKTGLLLDPYFSATKIKWLLDNNEAARKLADAGQLAMGTMDTWLIWNLSGGQAHVTDVSNASRTLLMNLADGRWDKELLDLLEIPESILPEIVASSGALAQTDKSLTGGVIAPIAGIAGDQQAALFGQACFEKGMVKSTYGTGCFILMNVGDKPAPSHNKLLATAAWKIGDKIDYALEGSVFIGGAAVQWLRDELKLIENAPEVEKLASSVEDSGGVVVVPAFAGLGAPHWDPYARGAVFGLTRGSNGGHLARATLESIALQVADLIEAMEKDSGYTISALQADGGASANAILMQAQADFSGIEVRCPEKLETTALGAAFLAGLAVGYWESREAIKACIKQDRSYAPDMDERERDKRVALWRKAVERSKGWIEE